MKFFIRNSVLAILLLITGLAQAQIYKLDSLNGQTVSTCKGRVVSSIPGSFVFSSTSGYFNDEADTVTFCSDAGSQIRANFYWLSLETNFDFLYIYDGPSTASPLIATLTGEMFYPGVFTSTGTCLTFRFSSDAGSAWAGFDCLLGCTMVPCNANPPAADDCASAPVICNLNGYCGNTSGWYTRDNGGIEAASAGGSDVFSCGTIQNNSWISFIANATTATFQITSSLCAVNTSGIQAIVLSSPDCANFSSVSNCISQPAPGTDVLTATGLVPGQKYYIMVDGVDGNDCRYDVIAQTGVEIANVTALADPICPGTNDTLTASAPAGTLSYNWIPAPLSGQGTATAVYNVGTTTTYSCEITGACGAVETPVVTISTLPATIVSVNDTTICSGDLATINASGADTYIWDAGLTAAGSSATGSPVVTTTYTVAGTSTATGCNDTSQFTINVTPLPVLTVPNDTVCLGNTVELVPSGATTYVWSDGSTNDTLNYLTSAVGITTFTVTGTANNCSSDTIVSVITNDVPVISAATIQPSLCMQANGSVSALISGGTLPYSYVWNDVVNSQIAGNNDTLSNVLAGQYQLIVTDLNNCNAISPVYTINDSASVTASFTANPASGTVPLTVTFTNTTTGNNTYSWDFDNGQTSVLQAPPAQIYNTDGDYQVMLAVDNGTCRDTTFFLISANSKSSADTIPNVFTPNADGINDAFQFGVTNAKIEMFEVYNRWGIKVYEKPEIETLTKIIWDGRTTSGIPCSDGTYFYIFKATGTDSSTFESKGFVTLIR